MTKVKTNLLFHRSVSGFATEVDVENGVVTLRGEAASQAQKDLTTEYAKDVKNEMAVVTTPKKPDEKMSDLGEDIDDASITALAKITLLYHRSTSGINTKIETNDGVGTLSGKTKNAAEKDLSAKYVNDINGVRSVKNQMTIE